MSKSRRRKGNPVSRGFDPVQVKLVGRIMRDLSQLLKARAKIGSLLDRNWRNWVIGVAAGQLGLKGDPAPDSATLSVVSGTTLTVTVALPENPSPPRTQIKVFASQDPTDFEELQVAYSADQPADDQLGSNYDVDDTEVSVFIKLTFLTSSGRKNYLAEFTSDDLDTVLEGTDVEIGLQLMG